MELLNLNDQSLTYRQKLARKCVLRALEGIEYGALTLVESFDNEPLTLCFKGKKQSAFAAIIYVHQPSFYTELLFHESIGAGESYMQGAWDADDLTQVIEIMAINLSSFDKIASYLSWVSKPFHQLSHWLNRNTVKNSKRNILAHYDLGNEMYATFLDPDMLYSSALYDETHQTLLAAQQHKMARLCEQLALTDKDHVLEIGTGWGAMAIYMTQHYGCHVTTTTISDQQYAYAKDKIEALGLSHKITLLKQDYRNLKGTFDKLVSIEMIEAVGQRFLPSYIKQCNRLLKPNGLMAIQAITIADQRYEHYASHVDFIQKYIFPGGFLPSVSVLLNVAKAHSGLVVRNLHDFGLDYAKTLSDWRHRFEASPDKSSLGLDETFIRLWRFYFCYCEGGFKAKRISVVHLLFEKS
jgi:cyclopropane-fatty-acyl-phospholipid synthase